jgi:O-antigen ligase
MLFPFITGKNFFFRILIEIVFACWVVLALKNPSYRPKFSWVLGSFAIFLVIVAIADMLGENPSKSFWSNFERMEGLLSLIHLFLYFVVLSSVFETKKIWNWFLGTWVGVSVIMCIYSLFQLAGKITINQGGVRVDGTLGNATYLAVFIMFSIFFTVLLFVRSGAKKNMLWIYIPVLILQLVILYETATRGAILGLIGGIIVTMLLTLFNREDKKLKKMSAVVLVSLLVLIAGFVAIRNTAFVKDSHVLSRFASISPLELKSQGRYYIWPMAVKGALENPIFGWGQENFNYIFNSDYNPKMYAQEQWFDRAHSTPLDWLVAGGIPGLLAYLSIFLFVLYYLWKDPNKRFSFLEKSIFTGLVSAYFFQNIFVFDNLVSYLLFVTAIAWIHSGEGRDIKWPSFMSKEVGQNVLASLVVIGIALSLYFFNLRPIFAGSTLIDTLQTLREGAPKENTLALYKKSLSYGPLGRSEIREQLANTAAVFASPGVSATIKEEYVALTLAELQKQLEETPNDMRYHAFYGIFLRNIGDYPGALVALEKAHELSPRKQSILFEIGSTQLSARDFVSAKATFKEAWDLEPSYSDAKLLYAVALLYNKEDALAAEILASLPPNMVLFDDRLVGALVDVGQYSVLVDIFTRRIQAGNDELQTNISLAVSLLRMGERQSSIETLESFIERKPEHTAELEPYIKQIKEGQNF